ncbi:MAG: AmmeMemoRadiSam system radical SAM enzyme [Thermodesulfovibrionales bacterium]|nr:AmmeMemoRadiSam system radical SAM enzyme [Thermodesulfovibrionales bacterium]
MKEALFFERLQGNSVRCNLCSHHCVILPDKRGKCGVRENRNGTLFSLVYGKVCAYNIDPIEKKPLFHFYPGSKSLSFSTKGCNFSCLHCQNYSIAQISKDETFDNGIEYRPENIVNDALMSNSKSISYTYSEPTVFFEFAYDTAVIAKQKGIKNVFVSNGYNTSLATHKIAPYLDANNIDLKGDDDFYKNVCGAKLQPVLDTIRLMKEKGVWVEVTTLIIPNMNDDDEFLYWVADFIKSIDVNMPWHITRFHPTHKLLNQPPTPLKTLIKARQIGIDAGLHYVYTGNVPGFEGEHTYCPGCKKVVIERMGFSIGNVNMRSGRCNYCGYEIAGVGMP